MKANKVLGFTVFELIVLLAMLGILVLLLLPGLSGVLLKANIGDTANKGAQVARSFYTQNIDRSKEGWPETYATNGIGDIDWSSSDKYFLDVVGGWDSERSNDYFNTISPLRDVDFTFLAAEGGNGATPLKGDVTDEQVRSKFIAPNHKTNRGGAHNAWCVTLYMNSSSKVNTPFMFTKNLRFSNNRINSLERFDLTKPDDPSSGPINEAVDILGGKNALSIGIQGNVVVYRMERYLSPAMFNRDEVDKPFIWPAGTPEPEE